MRFVNKTASKVCRLQPLSNLTPAAFVVLCLPVLASAADWKFSIVMSPEVRNEPFTGRVYLFFNTKHARDPRKCADMLNPEPFVSVDVEKWNPAEPLKISPATARLRSFPQPLADLNLAGARVQAVVRLNLHEPEVGTGPGNGFSSQIATLAQDDSATTELKVDSILPEPTFKTSDHLHELIVPSQLLTDFYKHEARIKAAVLLPASYNTSPERRYPVIIDVPGFGGTHYDVSGRQPVKEENAQGVEFIRVYMTPNCGRGHHVFADSENNGPVGQAFLTEFIPKLDAGFRTVAAPTARFLTGHSSGGWSTLWLQTTYPESFGGTWSTSPDPVDFRDFQKVDVYQPGANVYRDEAGQRRPIGHAGETILLWTDRMCDMESVLGPGGQLGSFEAVFSPRGADGQPRQLWDRRTGAVDRDVADTWKRYDIRLRLQSNWPTLGPQLAGKLHVITGSDDTFYLDGAARKLKATLEELKSDAVVEILPGKDHFNLYEGGLDKRIRQEMVEAFLKHHSQPNN